MIPRYTLPEMGRVWSEENKFQKWLQVEIAVCEVLAEMGEIPQKELSQIQEKAEFSIDQIKEIEEVTRHDMIAFTTAVAEKVGPASRFFHFGLTSTDCGRHGPGAADQRSLRVDRKGALGTSLHIQDSSSSL